MPENKDIERRNSDDMDRRRDNLVQRSLEYLKEFEEQGLANIEEPDLEGWDLHRAAWENNLDMARALIARGDDVDARDKGNATPLQTALRNSFEVARLLIEHGADVNGRDEDGETPLSQTAYQYSEVLRDMLSPLLHPAAQDNLLEIARLLIEHGANTDGIDLSWMEDQRDA
jgi:hypothetical protein